MINRNHNGTTAAELEAAFENARHAFDLARGEFHLVEAEFLQILDELWSSDLHRVRNLAKLDGYRTMMIGSADQEYRRALNHLVDALLECLGEPVPRRTD